MVCPVPLDPPDTELPELRERLDELVSPDEREILDFLDDLDLLV